MGKLDGKASEMVFGVCKQIEGAVMRSKDVANEQKTETLALGLGREKRSEEILRYSWRDAMTIVGDGERSWRGDLKGDKSLCRSDTLNSILDDVDEHLLEKDGIKMNGYCFVGQTEVNMDVRLRTQVFEEGATGFHLLAKVAELQLRLRNLYYFGKACSCGCGIFTTSAKRETKDERAVSRSASSPVRLPMMPATLLLTSWAIIRMTRS